MIGTFTRDGPITIQATRAEFLDLAVSLASGGESSIPLGRPKQDAGELNVGYLSTIAIKTTPSGRVGIGKDGGELCIEGPVEGLRVLAQKVSFLGGYGKVEGSDSMHLHVEYFPGHAFLRASAEPVILELLEERT